MDKIFLFCLLSMCSLGVGENMDCDEWMRDSMGLSLGEEDIFVHLTDVMCDGMGG